MRVGSLFAGIGGFDLAAKWVGWSTAWVSEIDPFACQVLAHHFPDAPNHGDITQIDFTTVEPVDILVGGFPCQDISNAGKQAGITGARSGLWFEYARAIRELRPRYVVVENVAALTNRGLSSVLGSLAEIGYDAEWTCFGAADVGAPHKRDRLWLLAYPIGQRGCSRDNPRQDAEDADAPSQAFGPGWDGGWWATEPNVGRLAHGVPARLAQLRGLGNSIVPQCAVEIFRTIADREGRLG